VYNVKLKSIDIAVLLLQWEH